MALILFSGKKGKNVIIITKN